eukprot:m.499488 g.499488  ORF g.499488 m.499488 type:complete len:451 (+) comp21825_c0_seq37:27-1379(+)
MVKCKSLLYYPTWLFEKSEICGLHACGKYHHMGANSERTFSRRIELSWQRAGWIICACIVLLMVISCHNSCLPKSVLHGLGYPRGKNTCTLRAICDLKHTDEELNKSIWGDLKRSTRTFNSSSRSPCWIDSISGRYRCLPGLMLIGNPKCGTTDVFERAIQHPLLARSRHKEPHWFTRHISLQSFDGARGNGTHGRGYLQNWDADDVRRGDLLTFEASPSTLWDLGRIRVSQQHSSGVLVPEGLRYLLGSRVKFVVCLCDPSRRMLSDYLAIGVRAYVDDIKRAAGARLDGNKTEQLTQGLQSPAYFHRHVTSAISHFERCEQRLTLLECLYVEPYQLHTPRPWLAVGAAAHFLQVWLRYFPPENFLIIHSESYYENPVPAIEKMLTFAGLPPMTATSRRAVAQMAPANVNQMKKRSNFTMLPATEALLMRFYSRVNTKMDTVLSSFAAV